MSDFSTIEPESARKTVLLEIKYGRPNLMNILSC